ncbi:MAG TPA: penicillin-binding transpeptidase domain-containing protein [Candidatus Acidoferrales bacterium]|nr:penicillin-binding transpeptidase domain-containing protein [Candidatus Acidoferrales bacterium]
MLCFAVLAARQLWLQVVVAQQTAASPYNPRNALLSRYRGSIVARDDTVLARSTAHGRLYPLGPQLAQTVGYVSQRYGTSGLERAFDAELTAPVAGNDFMTQVRNLFGDASQPRGATIVTTIDPVVEETLYDALLPYERAAGVAIDPRTGEILAIASVPSFDPQSVDADFASLRDDPQSALLNRAIDGLYPPGSTFKIFTAASALEDGVVTPESTFVDPGFLDVGSAVIHDDEGEATGTQDLSGAFAESSNVDFAQIAMRLGPDRWLADAAKWRLGEPVGLELPAQTDRLPTRAELTPSVLAQLGFGQADLLVTPLRMALVAATIASGGVEPHPHLVRAIREPGGGQRELDPGAPLAQPISAQTADEVRTLMIAVVTRGTGTAAAIPGVTVAGKTGTATNPAGRSHAWFVAFAPAEAPRVAVAVVVENVGYGGAYAAPIARQVLRAALRRS